MGCRTRAAARWLVVVLGALGTACVDDVAPGDGGGTASSGPGSGGPGSGGGGGGALASGPGTGSAGGGGPSAGGAGGGGASSGGAGGAGGGEAEGPARYPAAQTHSPITPFVAARLRDLSASGQTTADVFMKVGASSTVSRNTLFCFADGPVELGAHDALSGTLDFFLGGDAAGTTPFDRVSLAAESGRTAAWAIAGAPSPLEQEAAALDPALALLHYGTNDMGGGATYASALVAFHRNMSTLLANVEDEGRIPVLFGITRRGDVPAADRWVGTYNAALRGMAQRDQIPFIDLHHAIDPLPGHGLGPDGLHLEAYAGGACILDDAGLQHGYNVRNLVALEALDRVRGALLGAEAPDVAGPALQGEGTAAAPFHIDTFPFAHDATTLTGERLVPGYPDCSDTDESGPERWYRLELPTARRIRAIVLDAEGVDVDVHLVGAQASAEGCIARGHHQVEASLAAGTYHFAIDSFVDGGVELGGDYLFIVVECDADDDACGP